MTDESPSEGEAASMRLCTSMLQDLGTRKASCERHGPYVSTGRLLFGRRAVWTACAACAREADAEAMARAERERVAALQRRLEHATQKASIPARFMCKTFDDYVARSARQQEALRATRAYASAFEARRRAGEGLVLVGGTGTGKTHLACVVLRSALAQGATGLYTTAMRMVRMVRESWRRDAGHTESEVMAALERADLLVIDEIGQQYGTGGEQLIVGEVLEARYAAGKPTVIVGNENMRGLRGCIGERAFDRVRESSRVVLFDWESYRPGLADDGWK